MPCDSVHRLNELTATKERIGMNSFGISRQDEGMEDNLQNRGRQYAAEVYPLHEADK